VRPGRNPDTCMASLVEATSALYHVNALTLTNCGLEQLTISEPLLFEMQVLSSTALYSNSLPFELGVTQSMWNSVPVS
jgi:hypothetical protein